MSGVIINTMITLFDGSTKPIQTLQSGEWVLAGEIDHHQVIRVDRWAIDINQLTDWIVIEPNALGPRQPNQRLIMTSNHCLWVNGIKHLAREMVAWPGVQLEHVSLRTLSQKYETPIEPNNSIRCRPILYELHLTDDGQCVTTRYVANGIVLQSYPDIGDQIQLSAAAGTSILQGFGGFAPP